jgi:cytochrome c peroxidase
MKRLYYLPFFLLTMMFLLSANMHMEKPSFAGEAGTVVLTDPPVLPEEPYDYDIAFPQHILFNPWGTVDSSSINNSITPHGATLGRVLFYDKLLSSTNEVSCANCHKQAFAFADNVAFSEGVNNTLTLRNSPNLNDHGWGASTFLFSDQPLHFWDAREDNLEEMVLQPIEHDGELGKDLNVLIDKLNNSTYYHNLFANAFGDEEITVERIGSALAQFIRSMASFDSKFDRVMMGQSIFSPIEQAGSDLFNSSCGGFCHTEPHFGVGAPLRTGLDSIPVDLGAGGWTGNDFDIGKFRSPSLRNSKVTAPYMHDGRFETLEEVIDFYSDGIHPNAFNDYFFVSELPEDFDGFHFTESQKSELLAFLQTLSSETIISHDKWSDPFIFGVGVKPLALKEAFDIFPNPMHDATLIEWDNPQQLEYQFRLMDLQGQTVRAFQSNGSKAVIERAKLPAGVYLLEIKRGAKIRTERLVMQ